ncbi:hypothetical protein GQ457_13G012260 [Hibiscus cannabinus]
MDAPRGRRGRRPARGRGRGRGRRGDVIQDPLRFPDPPPASIDFQQVGAQYPPVGDPPIHVVEDPDEIDEAMVGRVVWRFLQRAGGPHLEAPKTTISERLLATGASFFDGVTEAAPNLADLWLDHIDRVLDELDYPADQRLRAYTALLKDQAYNWWGTVQRNTSTDQLTSDIFREKFWKRYIGERYLEAHRDRFLSLRQGDMSVTEYEHEFIELSKYATTMFPTERQMSERFERGLRIPILTQVASHRERVFDELVERARAAEDVETVMKESSVQTASSDFGGFSGGRPLSTYHFKRDCPQIYGALQAPTRSQSSVQTPTRGRGQSRPSRSGFTSGSTARGRPMQGRGPARSDARQPNLVYASRALDDRDAHDVIVGTFFIHSSPYFALMDNGSTHSYITSIVADNLGIPVEGTEHPITV